MVVIVKRASFCIGLLPVCETGGLVYDASSSLFIRSDGRPVGFT